MTTKEGGLRASIQNVGVGVAAIPDSVSNHWPYDEGSGSTLGDDQGSADGSITGATWQSLSDAIGGYYLSYDGVDDYTSLSDDPINYIYNGDFTLTAFIRPDDISVRSAIFSHYDGSDGLDFEHFDDGTLRLVHHGVAVGGSSLTLTQGDWQFVAVRYDASAGEATFRLNDTEDTVSLANPNAPASGTEARFARRPVDDFELDAGKDETTASDTYLSDSDMDELRARRSDV